MLRYALQATVRWQNPWHFIERVPSQTSPMNSFTGVALYTACQEAEQQKNLLLPGRCERSVLVERMSTTCPAGSLIILARNSKLTLVK